MSTGVSIFLGPLQSLLTYFQKDRHYQDDKKDAALLALQSALIATKKYLEDSGGHKSFNREEEYRLSAMWAEAAVKARHVSSEVALRLDDKAAYWSDHFEWSREEVLVRGIDLASIQEQIRTLLRR